jgi:hypothetical protein
MRLPMPDAVARSKRLPESYQTLSPLIDTHNMSRFFNPRMESRSASSELRGTHHASLRSNLTRRALYRECGGASSDQPCASSSAASFPLGLFTKRMKMSRT